MFTVDVTPESAGWRYAGLRVLELAPGGTATVETGEDELLVLPLAGGSATVRAEGHDFDLTGRAGVFERVTDFAYLPRDCSATIHSGDGGRYALPAARADRRLAPRYGPAEEVPVEVRGAGPATRQVTNFCAPEAFECDRLIAVEVLTPGGNWSSYPPHRHDTIEEIYYFETPGLAYQRVYGSTEVLREVRTGDVVLIPHGYHGPSMAAPGYDLYYLNVLAGTGPERTMAFCDDPAHAWVRPSWARQAPDPQVPMTDHRGRVG